MTRELEKIMTRQSLTKLAKLLFLWVPGFTILLTFVENHEFTLHGFLKGILFGDFVALICYGLVHFVETLAPVPRDRKASFFTSAFCLPPALYLADQITSTLFSSIF